MEFEFIPEWGVFLPVTDEAIYPDKTDGFDEIENETLRTLTALEVVRATTKTPMAPEINVELYEKARFFGRPFVCYMNIRT